MKTKRKPAVSSTVENVVVSLDVLRVMCDTTVRLTDIRQRGCSHLCVENFAPKCLANLIRTYTHNKGISLMVVQDDQDQCYTEAHRES